LIEEACTSSASNPPHFFQEFDIRLSKSVDNPLIDQPPMSKFVLHDATGAKVLTVSPQKQTVATSPPGETQRAVRWRNNSAGAPPSTFPAVEAQSEPAQEPVQENDPDCEIGNATTYKSWFAQFGITGRDRPLHKVSDTEYRDGKMPIMAKNERVEFFVIIRCPQLGDGEYVGAQIFLRNLTQVFFSVFARSWPQS
jgi:hypothetical protein